MRDRDPPIGDYFQRAEKRSDVGTARVRRLIAVTMSAGEVKLAAGGSALRQVTRAVAQRN